MSRNFDDFRVRFDKALRETARFRALEFYFVLSSNAANQDMQLETDPPKNDMSWRDYEDS